MRYFIPAVRLISGSAVEYSLLTSCPRLHAAAVCFECWKDLACWILISSPEFGASHQFAQSGEFEKALPEASMWMRTKGATAKSLTSLRRQYTNTIRHRIAPKKSRTSN